MDNTELIWICSVDIGKKNFCFYVEEINLKNFPNIKNIPKNNRYNENGTPTIKMQNILDKVCGNGKTILHKNADLTKNCKPGKYLDPETFYNMNDLLDTYGEYWDKCCIFIIEQQMRKNYMAMKLGQHCFSYFSIRYGRFKSVIEFPSYYKTQILGAEKIKGKQYKNGKFKWKTIDKTARKKWSVVKATDILTKRGEFHTIENIKTKVKKDDLADTLSQLQAFKYLYYIDDMKTFT
jgi:hypothetical protein